MTFNLQWVRDFVAKRVDYDSSEPSQAYGGTTADPWKAIDEDINDAYTELINEARLEVDQSAFLSRYAFTWAANSTTHQLPREIAYSKSELLLDITNNEVGEEVAIQKSRRRGGMFWQDSRTLHWGDTSGPSEAKSLIWEFLADAEELKDGADVPLLIPERHRHLIGWKAAVIARVRVDENLVPATWRQRVEKLTVDYIIDLAQGRLRFTVPPHVLGTFSDHTSGVTT